MMPDTIWVAVIGAIGVIIAGWIQGRVESRKQRRQIESVAADVAATKEEVKNTHTTNFRDDLDSFRDEMRGGFRQLRADVRSLHSDVAELNKADVDAQREHSLLWRAIRAITPGGTD